jgi:VCBS repeat-containing protein
VNRVKSEHRRFAAALSTAAALCLFLVSAHAVTLEWDANSETNVAGYRVYMGRQPRVYDSVLDVGNQTLAQLATIWRTTYFAVTAYDTDGLESEFSEEVSYVTLALNSLPVVRADQYVATRGSTLTVTSEAGVLANDSDADGDGLTVLLASPPNGALALNPNGSFSYTPSPDFLGTDSFSYRALDGFATSAVATVTIMVRNTNSPPIAQPDQYVTTKNVFLNIPALNGVVANDFDVDGDTLTTLLVSSTGRGTLSLNPNGSFVYTPALNFSGSDSFSYRVSDGKATSATATVTLIVSNINSAPLAQPDQYATTKNVPLNITPTSGVLGNDSDIDGQTLVALLVTSTTQGTLSLNPDGGFNYTPAPNFTGVDSFSYRATDGLSTSAVATVTLTVSATNSFPIAQADQYVTTRNVPLNVATAAGVLANDSDADDEALTALLVSSASHGTLSLNTNGSFSYTPALNYVGSDFFSYRVTDGRATSAVALVSITINPTPNSTPVVQPDQYITTKNTALNISAGGGVLANDSDAEGDTLTAFPATLPSHGTLTLNANGGFIYAPALNFTGTDSFSYRVSDGRATSAVAAVVITVNPSPNSVPTAQPDQYALTRNGLLSVAATNGVLINDSDADQDALVALLAAPPLHGLLLLNTDGSFEYTPTSSFVGTDFFSYRTADGKSTSAVATVTITISTNSAPTAHEDQYVTSKNVPLTVSMTKGILANDSDADGDGIAAIIVDSVTNGTLSLNANGSFIYTLALDFTGTDCFSYCATDGRATSAVTVVRITVNSSANAAPTAQADRYSTVRNAGINISVAEGVLANDFDANGDSLSALIASAPTNGTVSLNANGSFNYTPAANFIGTDSFTYRAHDGTTASAVAIVSITVNSTPNYVPVPAVDQYVGTRNTALAVSAAQGVLANDSDANGDPLTAMLVSPAAHGVLSLRADGSFNYTPAVNFSGTDSFSYYTTDGSATSAVATVTLVIDRGVPSSLNCLDCFATFDAVLLARSNVFPGVMAARWQMPTNVTCPQAGVLLFETLCRSLKGIEDAQIKSALFLAADCLVENLRSEATLRLTTASSDLAPSRWTTSASNQIATTRRTLDRAAAITNENMRGQLFASALASLLRTDRFIASGNLAPTELTGKSLVCKVAGSGSAPSLRFIFATESSLIIQTTNGTPVTVGNYSYARTQWNSGSLALACNSDIFGHGAGEIITVELKCALARGRVMGDFRGSFQFE